MTAGRQGDLEAGAGVGRPAISGGRLEFDGTRQAKLTEGAHVRVSFKGCLHLAAEQRGALGDLTRGQHGLQLAQRRAGDGAGERITREGMPVEEGLRFGELTDESLIDLFRRQRRGERQVAGGEALREAEEIGDDALALRRREGAETTEAGEDFVEDEVDTVLAAQGGDGFDEAGGLLDHTGGALNDGLEDDTSRRGGITLQDSLQRRQRSGGVGTGDLAGTFGMDRRGESLGGEEPRIEASMELGALAASEREGVVPDFLCLAKGLAAGYLPLAATLTSEPIYAAFVGKFSEGKTFFHGHTFSGNPLACAVARASLRKLKPMLASGQVAERATLLGREMQAAFSGHAHVRTFRQLGLTGSVEFKPASADRWPTDTRAGFQVALAARRHGLIIRPLGDSLLFVPPISIQPDEVKHLVRAVRLAMDEVLTKLPA